MQVIGEASSSPSHPHKGDLSPRQRAKSPAAPISLEELILPAGSLERDLDQLVSQYLAKRSPLVASLFDQEVLNETRDEELLEAKEEVERAIIDGDWGSIESYVTRPGLLRPQTQKAFLYMCYREQFLEHIENRESQKAFNLLQKRLKPLEHYQPYPYDFYTLSYLTSASTVHDAPSFRDWAGVGVERERLVRMWRELLDGPRVGEWRSTPFVEPDRLERLMRQAAAWQVQGSFRQLQASSKGSRTGYTVKSLLYDYRPTRVPTSRARTVTGHTANVKCVSRVGQGGGLAVSGSSDTTLRVFSVSTGETRQVLRGHTSRVWSCASPSTDLIASGSGDGSVRIWSVQDPQARQILSGEGGDVYGVAWRPMHDNHVVSASYDRIIRLWDIEKQKQIRTFSGHTQSTLSVAVGQAGKMIASGSKDRHIRLWDAVGGVCVHHMVAALGEITSLSFDREGKYLLAGCRDNSNRLWDTRMQRNLYRYTGHQNTSKNFIRCSFDPTGELVVGGSEDGNVYIWEREGASSSAGQAQAVPSSVKQDGGDSHLTVPMATGPSQLASPAHYPLSPLPGRNDKQVKDVIAAGTAVAPLHVLSGRGTGAIFDVAFSDETLFSAAEDGSVEVWEEESKEA